MNNTKLSENEFDLLIPLLWKVVLGDSDQRERFQALGLNITLANFYSSTPSVSEITDSYEYVESLPPYLNEVLFNQKLLHEGLEELIEFCEDFNPPENGDEDNCDCFFWKNSQFSYSDAMAYYAYIRLIKPKTVFEIGSGFSSLIALEALKKNGAGELKCIEPFPRPFIKTFGNQGQIDLHQLRAQDLTPELLNKILSDGDVLFIDSTHTIKTGSDCLHVYLRLLPFINKKIYVHVHDIFLPFGLPQEWLLNKQIFWTEQYLLLALMIDNPRVTILYGSAYHQHFNKDMLDKLMYGRFPSGGSSFWFVYDGRNL